MTENVAGHASGGYERWQYVQAPTKASLSASACSKVGTVFFSNDCTIGIIFIVSTMDLKARVYWMSLVASALLNMVFASASVTLATGGMPWTSMLSSHAVYFRNLQTRLMHIHVSKQLATKSYYINLS